MAQIKQTCSVINGGQTVTVSGINLTDRIRRNAVFMLEGELVPYTVAADSTYTGGNTVIKLSGAYQGATNAAAPGVFAVDMTYPDLIPTIAQGDVGTAAVFTKAMYRIQDLVKSVAPGGLDQFAQYYTDISAMYNNVREAAEVLTPALTTIDAKVTAASDSATAAANSAAGIGAQATLAQNWATSLNNTFTGSGGLYGSRKYANDAASSATAAAGSATAANTSATNAATSATTASGHVTTAQNWATSTSIVANSMYGARKYATDAAASATTAQDWASKATVVSNGVYSAKYYAEQAKADAATAVSARDSIVGSQTAVTTARDLTLGYRDAALGYKNDATAQAGIATTQANRAQSYADQMASGQVNADWNETSNASKSFILNKPDIVAMIQENALPTGTTAQYIRGDKALTDFGTDVRAAKLTGLSTSNTSAAGATDSFLVGIGKLQAQMNRRALIASPTFTGTPEVPVPAAGTNTAQIAPTSWTLTEITTAVNTLVTNTLGGDAAFAATVTAALDGKEPAVPKSGTFQFYRGDKTWADFGPTVRSTVMTGFSSGADSVPTAGDQLIVGLGKLQGQITALKNAPANLPLTGGTVTGAVQATTFNTKVIDLGSVSGSITIDYRSGQKQKVKAIGAITGIYFSNWPELGYEGLIEVDFTDFGNYAVTPPNVIWTNPDGTETTSLAAHFAALAVVGGRSGFNANGRTKALFWSDGDNVTLFGAFI